MTRCTTGLVRPTALVAAVLLVTTALSGPAQKALAVAPTPTPAAVINFGGALGLNYVPNEVHVAPGGIVEWQGAFSSHPLVSDEALWTTVNTGTVFRFAFDTLGVHLYHCQIHVALGMTGQVVVDAPTTPTPSSTSNPAPTATPTPIPHPCVGDCNGDGEVTVNELIQMVNIALGNANVSTCTAGDANGDGSITVNEIVGGVNNALNGCPSAPTPTPT